MYSADILPVGSTGEYERLPEFQLQRLYNFQDTTFLNFLKNLVILTIEIHPVKGVHIDKTSSRDRLGA